MTTDNTVPRTKEMSMSKTLLAPNGRKISKGQTLPVVAGVPIQWHLRSSLYDYCHQCGGNDIGYITQSKRACLDCANTVELTVEPEQWWQEIGSRQPVLNRDRKVKALQ